RGAMPAKHALIIGIDQYSNFEERYQLSGCVNDARLVKSVLIDHFGFKESDVTELHNAAASQQGILNAMEQLVERACQDDIVVFHYSGHGSQRTSANPDEGTGMDSTITPADSGCVDPFPNLDIIDDVIHEWLDRLARKTRYITLIFDCCHSGTITRDAFGAKARSVPADRRSLSAMGVDADKLPTKRRARSREIGSGGLLDPSDAYVVMSGCRDDEFSHEYEFEQGGEPVRSGALTHFLTHALLRARPGSTYRDVFEQARQGVNTRFPQQHPQIEGTQDREIFGVKDIEPLQFIPVASLAGDTVTLRGGAAHGLFAGSLWAAYPQDTKQTRGTAPLGMIEITRVGALTSEGVIREGQGQLTAGARCVESAPAAGQFLLSIDLSQLDTAAGTALREGVEQSRLLVLARTPGAADMRACILTPEKQALASENDTELAEIDAPSWAIVDRAGALAMPLHAVNEHDVIGTLVSNLEAMARYRNALRLDNSGSALEVDFNIYRVGPEGDLENANGGDFEFEEGERVAFEVINREGRSVFVSVLDFGLTGRISLLYPKNRAGEMITAGRTLQVGTGERKFPLGVPGELRSNRGTETLKAFISTDEADFRWLQQGGVRSADTRCLALRRQFEAAYNGPATRDVVDGAEDRAEDDWKAVARSFELRRRPVGES
ncbi:MAG: caspase family protein, partial [Lysobacterales bacterium]